MSKKPEPKEVQPTEEVSAPEAAKPETVADPNSPNALKAAAEEKEQDAPRTKTYAVLKTQFINGGWVKPSDDKTKPKTVELLEVQARHRVLSDKLKLVKDSQKA